MRWVEWEKAIYCILPPCIEKREGWGLEKKNSFITNGWFNRKELSEFLKEIWIWSVSMHCVRWEVEREPIVIPWCARLGERMRVRDWRFTTNRTEHRHILKYGNMLRINRYSNMGIFHSKDRISTSRRLLGLRAGSADSWEHGQELYDAAQRARRTDGLAKKGPLGGCNSLF